MPPLKNYFTQSDERMFICGFWEQILITSTFQLGTAVIYHKPNGYDSVLRQWNFSVSQSGSWLVGNWSVSQSFSQSMINQSDISNLVSQLVSQSMKQKVNYQSVFQSVIYLPINMECLFNIKDRQLHTAFPTNSRG